MSENDKSAKGPKTLFSMGRGNDKRKRGGVIVDDAVPAESETPPPPTAPTAETETDVIDDDVLVYFCGECGDELHPGAAFCGECGTPVAFDDDTEIDTAEQVEPDADAAIVPAYAAVGAEAETEGLWSADELDEEYPVGELAADDVFPGDDAEAEVAAPAATLYGETGDFEPLPPPPSSGWDLATPVMGTGAQVLDDDASDVAAPAAEAADVAEADEAEDTDDRSVAPLVGAGVAAGIGATVAAGAAGAAADEVHPYDSLAQARHAPVAGQATGGPGTGTGSKKGLWIAAAAVVVVLGIIAVIALAGGGTKTKTTDDNLETASQVSTTTTAGSSTSTSSTASSTTTTTEDTTTTTAAPTTAAPTTAAPSSGGGSTGGGSSAVVPGQPAAPASVSVSPGGGKISIPSYGSFTITLTNEGGGNGQFQVRATGLTGSTSGSLGAGQSTTITISDGSGGERHVPVSVVAAGSGTVSYDVYIGCARSC